MTRVDGYVSQISLYFSTAIVQHSTSCFLLCLQKNMLHYSDNPYLPEMSADYTSLFLVFCVLQVFCESKTWCIA